MRIFHVLCVLILAVGLTACSGYQFTANKSNDAPFTVPAKFRTLFLKSVENPTMNPDLSSRVRAEIRDELNRRGGVKWVAKSDAKAFMDVTIERFYSTTALTDADDETLTSSASVALYAVITSAGDGAEIWRSPSVSASRTFTGSASDQTESEVLELAIQRLADKMHYDY